MGQIFDFGDIKNNERTIRKYLGRTRVTVPDRQ